MTWFDAPRWLRLMVWLFRARLDISAKPASRPPTLREAWRGTFEPTETDLTEARSTRTAIPMEDALRGHLVEDHGLGADDLRLGVPWITHTALHQRSCDHREADLWQPKKEVR